MDASSIAGLVGIIAAGCGLYIMLYTMGYFQYLGGKKQRDIPPVGKQELIDKILMLNDPSKPYHIAKGIDTGGLDDATFILVVCRHAEFSVQP